jgi:hypothetical protein
MATEKEKGKSSMEFIREAVGKNPEITFEKLVAAVRKAGYETKEISIKAEYLKTKRKLGTKRAKASKKPVVKKEVGG